MSKPRILYVEDDKFQRETIVAVLERAGFDVLFFNTVEGAKVAAFLEHNRIALFLCDGTLDDLNPGTGEKWAVELLDEGKKVLLFSTCNYSARPDLPFYSKKGATNEGLIARIRQLLG